MIQLRMIKNSDNHYRANSRRQREQNRPPKKRGRGTNKNPKWLKALILGLLDKYLNDK